MKSHIFLAPALLVAAGVAALVSTGRAGDEKGGDGKPAEKATFPRAVLVELFTSQG